MAQIRARARYRYRRRGTTSWSMTGWAGYVSSQSEFAVLREIQKVRRNDEIELVSIEWV